MMLNAFYLPCSRCGLLVPSALTERAPFCDAHRGRWTSTPWWVGAVLFGAVWRAVHRRAAAGSPFWRRVREALSEHSRRRVDRLQAASKAA